MKKNNNKGFTLIELLAVVVILILIIFIAITKVRQSSKKAQLDAIKSNAGVYIKAVNEFAGVDNLSSDRMYSGTYGKLFLDAYGVKVNGTLPDIASITMEDFEVVSACLTYGRYKVTYADGKLNNPIKGTCPTGDELSYEYIGREQDFVVPIDGLYRIEAWGAQGGRATSYNGNEVLAGGTGGYSVGEIQLKEGQVIYINVGGKGTDDFYPETGEGSTPGGYNGGGSAYGQLGSEPLYRVISGSGGGASSVSFNSGILSSLSSKIDSIIIVAGGGGGATSHRYGNSSNYWRGYGGNGGGFTSVGGTGFGRSKVPTSATQVTAGCGYDNNSQTGCGSFGKGQNASYSGGGGGGFYGGGASVHSSTSGGSGYIGSYLLSNKSMYCNNCTESNEFNTKTVKTTCNSATAKSNCAKLGDGAVKITLVSKNINLNKYYYMYTGEAQTFTAPKTGNYKVELWGAQGMDYDSSNIGGKGGYTSGIISLNKDEHLFVYVGGKGVGKTAGYNGGATGGSSTDGTYTAGGGATDVRLVSGNWNNEQSLNSRIMVAGGGAGSGYYWVGIIAGGNAGGLTGESGTSNGKGAEHTVATGGTQTSAGLTVNGADSSSGFGYSTQNNIYGTGGGGGYYGGGSGSSTDSRVSAGAGGSSYISGHTGCVAIKSSSDQSPKDGCDNGTTNNSCSIHYSNKVFTNTILKSGSEEMPAYDGVSTITGNTGNGLAIITLID